MHKKEHLQELHFDLLCDPLAWEEKADHLIAAAALVRPKVTEFWQVQGKDRKKLQPFLAVHLMICSFAIENLLKAILVAERKEEIENTVRKTAQLPKLLNTHNIRELCREVRVEIEPPENAGVWNQLTRAAEWYGRYPAPLRPQKLPAADVFSMGKNFVALDLNSSADIEIIDGTIDALRNRLRKSVAPGKTGLLPSLDVHE